MNTYTTSEVAKIIGIHPNTVRLYEEWGLIPKAERKTNGYRVFTDFHIEQFRLARTAFQIEVLQNGLRKKIVETVKVSAKKDFDQALVLANEYLSQIQKEVRNAELNGLMRIKRKQNGYRYYTDEDIKRLKIIRSLRCANYSLEAILRMLHALSDDPHTNIKRVLNTPKDDTDIISVCDRLIISLQKAAENAKKMIGILNDMKSIFS